MRARTASEAVLAIALAAIVVATAAVFGSGRASDADLRCSTFVDDRNGAHALLLVLEESGAAVDRAVEPVHAGTPTQRTHVVLAPSWPVTRPEAAALLDWVARGGRLVVADSPSTRQVAVDVAPLLGPLGLRSVRTDGGAADVTAVPESWRREIRTTAWPAHLALVTDDAAARDPRAGAAEDLVSHLGSRLAVRVPFGDGEVVAVSDASLFANGTLRRADNAVLAVRLVAAPGRPVVFDEFHHGFTPTGPRGSLPARLARMLVTTWTGRAVLVLVLAGAVFAAGAAVRLGAPLPERAEERRKLREHADALGRLLEQAQASREALGLLLGGVRRRVGTRIGLGPRATPGELGDRLARSVAPGAGDLAAAVADAADGAARGAVKDVDLARLAANLASARRAFLRAGRDR